MVTASGEVGFTEFKPPLSQLWAQLFVVEKRPSLNIAITGFAPISNSLYRRNFLRVGNFVPLLASTILCVFAAGMIAVVPFGIYVALHISSIVVAVFTLVGGWTGYVSLRLGIALLRIRIRMLREGRKTDNEADAAILEASLVWPISGKASGENAE